MGIEDVVAIVVGIGNNGHCGLMVVVGIGNNGYRGRCGYSSGH